MSNTKKTAQNEAAHVADQAKERGQEVAATAKDEAAQVAQQAKGQASDLIHQARAEVDNQAGSQQQRLAQGLRGLGQEFSAMVEGAQSSDAATGTATHLTRAAASQIDSAAQWLESREPADVLNEVTRYARRNPGTFLLGAAVLGLIGGRLTRSLTDEARSDARADNRYQFDGGYPHRVRSGFADAHAGDLYDREGYPIRRREEYPAVPQRSVGTPERPYDIERDVTDLGSVDGYVGNGGRVEPTEGRERL